MNDKDMEELQYAIEKHGSFDLGDFQVETLKRIRNELMDKKIQYDLIGAWLDEVNIESYDELVNFYIKMRDFIK